MAWQARGRATSAAAIAALVGANARFWPTVLPEVRRELRRWDRRAQAIPDDALRRQALAKLQHERFNTEVAATLATLVAPMRRHRAVEAIVALEVMYDYLDGLTEQPVPEPLADGRQLYRAFADAFAPAGPLADHYLHHPQRDDGGYLSELASTCRRAVWSLPAAAVAAPVACAVMTRCGEAQTRTHAVARHGSRQLRAWASAQPEAAALRWWEVASGAAASVLAGHALIAVAADPATTAADARRIADAYLATCALTTLLDSLIDLEADAAAGGHAYLDYYRDDVEAATRLGVLARAAVARARRLPRAPHHLMTVAGAVAFYLSAPAAGSEWARRLTAPMAEELRPLLAPALAIFGAWRGAKRWRGVPWRGGARGGGAWGGAPERRTARRTPSPRRRAHVERGRAAWGRGAWAWARGARARARGAWARAAVARRRALTPPRRLHAEPESVEASAGSAVTYGGMESPIPGTMGAMQTASRPSALFGARVTLAAPCPGLDVAADAIVASRRGPSGPRGAGSSRAPARSLAHQLERDRLEQRAARVRQVIHALRERAAARDTTGGAPRPLRAAIEDFARELAELERRLRHHGSAGSAGH
jgi:tetraprenyl-beta-curcumene synthase